MFDLAALRDCVAEHGAAARIVIASHQGSSPREAGTAMLVWAGGQSGTIGGGALEWQAVQTARARIGQAAPPLVQRLPLGPALGQCCGGAVTLVTEVFTPATLPRPQSGLIARALDGSAMPLAVRRLLGQARAQGALPAVFHLQGWLAEPLAEPCQPVWIWGAGHVGRACAQVLAPLPGLALTLVDTAPDRFPSPIPEGVTALPAPDLCAAVALAPGHAHHLIMTFSHALDLDLCHHLLHHGFATCGLIGSASKWARFRARLAALGHGAARIGTIHCPIGDPALGKHPQAIAIGAAARILAAQPVAAKLEGRG